MFRIYVDKNSKRVLYTASLASEDRVPEFDKDINIYEVEEVPQPESKELYKAILYYDRKKFYYQYEIDADLCYGRINGLQAKIASTDYVIVKSTEYLAVGKEPDYDLSIIHNERQALRDEINRLQVLIDNNLEG